MPEIGQLLSNRYRILEVVGKGGMGTVYKAQVEAFDNKLVAIKELRRDPEEPRAIEQFRREASFLANLRHPHLVQVSDFFHQDNHTYLVMDFVEGQPLNAVLKGGLAPERVLHWAVQLCSVLDYLHHQNPPVLFRDLKPSNIMLTAEDEIRLIDFGIARQSEIGQTTSTFLKGVGSAGYAPLEQYDSEKPTDARSDIYALGATLHHLLTGRLPPSAVARASGEELPPLAEPGLNALVQRCCALKPQDRFQNISEVRSVLLSLQETPLEPATVGLEQVDAATVGMEEFEAPTTRVTELDAATVGVEALDAPTLGIEELELEAATVGIEEPSPAPVLDEQGSRRYLLPLLGLVLLGLTLLSVRFFRSPDMPLKDARALHTPDLNFQNHPHSSPPALAAASGLTWLSMHNDFHVDQPRLFPKRLVEHLGKKTDPRSESFLAGIEAYLSSFHQGTHGEVQGWRRQGHSATDSSFIDPVFLAKLMESKAAVWLNLGWYQRNSEQSLWRRGGQWVTLVGADDKTLRLVDPSALNGSEPVVHQLKVSQLQARQLLGDGEPGLPLKVDSILGLEGDFEVPKGTEQLVVDAAVFLWPTDGH